MQLKKQPTLEPHEVPPLAARFMPELRGRQQSIGKPFEFCCPFLCSVILMGSYLVSDFKTWLLEKLLRLFEMTKTQVHVVEAIL